MLQGYKVLNLESNQFKPVKATLSKGKLSLNNALFQAIGFPFYYRLLFNKDLKRIVVEACEPLDEAAIMQQIEKLLEIAAKHGVEYDGWGTYFED